MLLFGDPVQCVPVTRLAFFRTKNNAVLWGRGRHGAGHPSHQKNILANASKHHSCQEPPLHEKTVTRTVVPAFRHQIFPRPVGGMSQVKQKHFLSGQALNGLLRAPEQKAPPPKKFHENERQTANSAQLSQAIPQFHVERIPHQQTPIARFESQCNERRVYEDQILCL